MSQAIEDAANLEALRALRGGMKSMTIEVKQAYVQKEQLLRSQLSPEAKGIKNMYRPISRREVTENALSAEQKAEFENYAARNGYAMSITKQGNIVFRNSDGKIVRRIDINNNGQIVRDTTFIQEINQNQTSDEAHSIEAITEPPKTMQTQERLTNIATNNSVESVSPAVSSSVYQQLQKEQLILKLEDKSITEYDPVMKREVIIKDADFKGRCLQIAIPIVVDGQAHLRLDGRYELKFNSPEIKNILDGLNPGEEITVGRDGNIKIENQYSKRHLIIKKLSANRFEVTPLGGNGTELKSEVSAIPSYFSQRKAEFEDYAAKNGYTMSRTSYIIYFKTPDGIPARRVDIGSDGQIIYDTIFFRNE